MKNDENRRISMKNDERLQIIEKIMENFEGKTVEESLYILEMCKLGIIKYAEQVKKDGEENDNKTETIQD